MRFGGVNVIERYALDLGGFSLGALISSHIRLNVG